MYWLHHIGKSYWTMAKFRAESRKYGVSRRISINTAKDMRFGDTILICQWDGTKTVVFGQFKLTTVYFENPETLRLIDKDLVEVSVDHKLVSRGCGSYSIVGETTVSVPLEEVIKSAEKTGDRLMIGGEWEDIDPFILKKVPHRLGFRPFDMESAMSDVTKRNKKGWPVLYGQYYIDKDIARLVDQIMNPGGKLVRIVEYRRKDDKVP